MWFYCVSDGCADRHMCRGQRTILWNHLYVNSRELLTLGLVQQVLYSLSHPTGPRDCICVCVHVAGTWLTGCGSVLPAWTQGGYMRSSDPGTGYKDGCEPPHGCWEPAPLQEPGLQCSEPQPSLCAQRQLGTQLEGGRLLPPPCPSSFQDGEMVLLDGGCESSCYVSDITRTWPVNGR